MLYATLMMPVMLAYSALDGSRLAGSRIARASVNMAAVPAGAVFDVPEGTSFFPPSKMDLAEYSKGKNLIVVGLPGAFTPTWSSRQIPSYLEGVEALKAVGVDEVIIYCVNDAAVMGAWRKAQGADSEDFIKFVGDPWSKVTSALDMEMVELGEGQAEIDGTFGPFYKGLKSRCKRFAMYIKDGEIVLTKVAQALTDPAGDDFPEATLADTLISDIKALDDPEAAAAEAAAKAALPDPTEEIKEIVGGNKVVVFSKDYCPFCKKTKELFDEKGIAYTAVEINLKANAAEYQAALLDMTGQGTVPNVFVGGSHLGGNDDTQAAAKSGKLEEMLA